MNALSNANIISDDSLQKVRVTPNLPSQEQKSELGVSVDNAPSSENKWYVVRATYMREIKTYDYLTKKGIKCFLPLRDTTKETDGKKYKIKEPLLPHLVFVYTSEEKIIQIVKHTSELSFLSFYYNHFKKEANGKNPPLTVSDKEMENFITTTSSANKNVMIVTTKERCHYKSGNKVKIVKGEFKGVEGYLARYSGQQRVIVKITGICMVATAYIPTAFIQEI